MKNTKFGKKKLGTGVMIVGGLLTVVGATVTLKTLFSKSDKGEDVISSESEENINVCEEVENELDNNFLEEEEEEEMEEEIDEI